MIPKDCVGLYSKLAVVSYFRGPYFRGPDFAGPIFGGQSASLRSHLMATATPSAHLEKPAIRRLLGPGLITGASDDDPSGIATYSQLGAQFGYGMLWTMLFSYPFMAVI